MQELFKGLRWELIDCTGHAHSAPECGCGCPWPSDVASEAADLIKSQAAEIEKYKALHDQMGNALEWYCRQNEDPDSQEILEAWRSMK